MQRKNALPISIHGGYHLGKIINIVSQIMREHISVFCHGLGKKFVKIFTVIEMALFWYETMCLY